MQVTAQSRVTCTQWCFCGAEGVGEFGFAAAVKGVSLGAGVPTLAAPATEIVMSGGRVETQVYVFLPSPPDGSDGPAGLGITSLYGEVRLSPGSWDEWLQLPSTRCLWSLDVDSRLVRKDMGLAG